MNNSNISHVLKFSNFLFQFFFKLPKLYVFSIQENACRTHNTHTKHTFICKYIIHVLSSIRLNKTQIEFQFWSMIFSFYYFFAIVSKKIKLPTILLEFFVFCFSFSLENLFSKLKLFPFTFAIRNIIYKKICFRTQFNIFNNIICSIFLYIIAWSNVSEKYYAVVIDTFKGGCLQIDTLSNFNTKNVSLLP